MSNFDPPLDDVRAAVARALAEDLGPVGDVTAALVPGDATAVADVVAARAACWPAPRARPRSSRSSTPPCASSGWSTTVPTSPTARRSAGCRDHCVRSSRASAARSNFLCHLSGVATATHRFVVAAGPTAVRILDTRKTLPGLRALEKAAVRAGGGANHRGSLSDFVLLKDNHLAGIGITDAVARATRRGRDGRSRSSATASSRSARRSPRARPWCCSTT